MEISNFKFPFLQRIYYIGCLYVLILNAPSKGNKTGKKSGERETKRGREMNRTREGERGREMKRRRERMKKKMPNAFRFVRAS